MELRFYPDPILTEVSEPVTDYDGLDTFCNDLYDTMIEHNGAGLSAVQVGVLKRVVVMQVPGKLAHAFINPEIRDTARPMFNYSEGCLSVPGFFDDRDRYSSVLLRYEVPSGEVVIKWFEGIEAFCIQHEMDHLDGKLFIDDISPLKKDRIRKKIVKTIKRSK